MLNGGAVEAAKAAERAAKEQAAKEKKAAEEANVRVVLCCGDPRLTVKDRTLRPTTTESFRFISLRTGRVSRSRWWCRVDSDRCSQVELGSLSSR